MNIDKPFVELEQFNESRPYQYTLITNNPDKLIESMAEHSH